MEISKVIDKLFSRRKYSTPASIIFSLVCFVGALVLLILRGINNFEPIWAVSVGADIVALAIAIVLLIGIMMNREGQNEYYRVFVVLITVIAFELFLDVGCWSLNGLKDFRTWNLIINVLYYLNSSVLIFFFWRYVKGALNLTGKFMNACNLFLNILYVPTAISCIVNFFYPLFFYVDEEGFYQRTDLFIYSQVFLAVALVVFVIGLFVSKAPKKTKLIMASFILIPLANQAVAVRAVGITTSFAAMLISVVLIYVVVVAEREKTFASTESELNLATKIQASMLPSMFPPFPNREEIDLYATMDPAKEVGGDFYDFFYIDDDHLAMVMADVSGKGVPAALYMMATKILIKTTASRFQDPGKILAFVNDQVCATNREEMFVTVWLGILDVSTGKLTAANAGHEYPVFKHTEHSFELFKDKHGFVIGGMPGVKYKDYEIQLEPGSKIFIYTDGLAEATNDKEELFGTDRMIEALNSMQSLSPEETLKGMKEKVMEFVGDAPQFDDLTMLCLTFNGKKNNGPAGKTIRVRADVSKMDELVDFVNGCLEEMECPFKIQTQIDVALDEIFSNIAHYAYPNGEGEAEITVQPTTESKGVLMTFKDRGVPYDPLQKEEPDISLSAEERQIGGLGIFIVKKTMDDVSYRYEDGQNVLTVKKLFV